MNRVNNPVQIEFGRGAIKFLPRFINGRKALLITSQGFVKRGIVSELLSDNSEIIRVIDEVQSNPTITQIIKMRSSIKYDEFDVIVALGGGSVIDVAKAIAPTNFGNKLDFKTLLQTGLPKNVDVKPIIAIPTTAGTGSEVTMWGTVWDDVNKKKYSISDEKLYCEAAILDPLLHLTLPKDITLQTGLDALSHSLETIWNRNSNEISSIYADNAIRTILEVLPMLLEDLSNIELRERMLLASYHAGVAFSITQTSIAHAMSYYMTLEKNIPHGIAASITLPYIAEAFGENTSFSMDLIPNLYDLFEKCNLSLSFEVYGLTMNDFDEIFKQLESNVRAKNSIVDLEILYKIIESHFRKKLN
ncbi:phosphonoacetaldehyde reductase [Lysinibacillus sp. NPDC097287]|uniref:phosphonoacetaldehyde reductase n=1 Tax=Lysinibacillus sp. NPDC097287 TaxID=3364144 RepID=UPI00382BB35D